VAKLKNEKRVKAKLALVEKYERLINLIGGRKKKQIYRNRIEKFRNQAAELARE